MSLVTLRCTYFISVLQFRKRIYKGIPNSLRGETWKKLLGVDKIPNRKETYEVHVGNTFHVSSVSVGLS